PRTLLLRQLSAVSGVPFRQIEGSQKIEGPVVRLENLYGRVTDTAPAAVLKHVTTMSSWRGRLYLVDGRGKTIQDILYETTKLAGDVGAPDGVIIDWFGNHKMNGDYRGNRTEALLADLQDLANYCTNADTRTRMLIAAQ